MTDGYRGMVIGIASIAASAAAYATGFGDIVTEYVGMDHDNMQWCVARSVEASPFIATALGYAGKGAIDHFWNRDTWEDIKEFFAADFRREDTTRD